MIKIPTIFIVEDDRDLQEFYTKMLTFSGFEVIGTADDGVEAVKKFKNFEVKPDLIIMDHIMPRKNGLEAAEEILELDSSAKILFASADRTIKREALAIGASYFLAKPFKIANFLAEIKSIFQ